METTDKIISQKLARLQLKLPPEQTAKLLRGELKTKLSDIKSIYQSELSPAQKADLLYQRLTQQVQVTKRVDIQLISTKKKLNLVSRQKGDLIQSLTNQRAMKKRMEQACREFQKQNRIMQDQCSAAVESENAKREELRLKLQETLDEVTHKYEENEEQRKKYAQENEELKSKLYQLRDSAIARDTDYKSALQQKAIQLHMCKTQIEHKNTLSGFQLGTQLSLYKDRFQDFQSTIQQSNSAFKTLKVELDKLAEMLEQEEKTNAELRKESDVLDFKILEMLQNNQEMKAKIAEMKKKQVEMKAVCAGLLSKKPKQEITIQGQFECFWEASFVWIQFWLILLKIFIQILFLYGFLNILIISRLIDKALYLILIEESSAYYYLLIRKKYLQFQKQYKQNLSFFKSLLKQRQKFILKIQFFSELQN